MRYIPRHLNIETSDKCNRSCTYCPLQHARDNSPARLLDDGVFDRLLDELAALSQMPGPQLKVSLQWIDEPLVHDRFFDYAERAVAKVPGAMWLLQTNGDFLDDTKAKQLDSLFDAIAVNAYAESAHQRLERLDIDVDWASFKRRIQSPGRLRRSRSSPSSSSSSGRALWHINQKYHDDDWVQSYDEVQVAPDVPCMRLYVQAAVAFNGDVHICCRDNLKAHPVGNLNEMSLVDAYNSESAQQLRHHMEHGRRDRIAMCHQCPGDHVEVFASHVDDDVELPDDRSRLPFGRHAYTPLRTWAKQLGHAVLPGILPRRYEVVVGVTRAQLEAIVDDIKAAVGDALLGVFVCGSRVVNRSRLFELDPSVFAGQGTAGTLPMPNGVDDKKARVRVLGADPRVSSDLDLKVLVDEDDLDAAACKALEHSLGMAVERHAGELPVSGHVRPLLRLIRVPRQPADAAFHAYNAQRPQRLQKGPLSLEYVQRVYDPVVGAVPTTEEAMHSVAALLVDDGVLHDLSAVTLNIDDAEALRQTHAGVSAHQWECVLRDVPQKSPPGIVVDDGGRVVEGEVACWSARRAGRKQVHVTLLR